MRLFGTGKTLPGDLAAQKEQSAFSIREACSTAERRFLRYEAVPLDHQHRRGSELTGDFKLEKIDAGEPRTLND